MANDDDFFDPFEPEKTVILPTPGGRSNNASIPAQATPPPAKLNTPLAPPESHGHNAQTKPPLLARNINAEQNSILGNNLAIICYAAELRQLSTPPDQSKLFNELVLAIKQMGENLRKEGQTEEIIVTSRYLTCSFVDEMILNTPWGATGRWSTQSLLSFFHKEAQGGAKFFDIMNKIEQQSARYIDLIELIYTCLSLGYLGQYRIRPDGASQVSGIQENLYQQIRQIRQHQDLPLSRISEGVDTRKNPLTQGKALWLTASISIALLLITYGSLLFNLNTHSDPVAIQARALSMNIPPLIKKARTVTTVSHRTSSFDGLAQDLANGTLDIQKTPNGIKFILFGTGLFSSGSAQVINSALIKRIADNILQLQGSIKVIGHTDNVPIRTFQFPSNLYLSKQRAVAIAAILGKSMNNQNIQTEGMADLQPLFANSTAANRAKNRRVEILLLTL